jgi:hypothetical protein
MKRLFSLALLVTASLAGSATPSFAGTFGLFYSRCCCSPCCCRGYNAFTPPCCCCCCCCPSPCCGGCCPSPCGGGGCPTSCCSKGGLFSGLFGKGCGGASPDGIPIDGMPVDGMPVEGMPVEGMPIEGPMPGPGCGCFLQPFGNPNAGGPATPSLAYGAYPNVPQAPFAGYYQPQTAMTGMVPQVPYRPYYQPVAYQPVAYQPSYQGSQGYQGYPMGYAPGYGNYPVPGYQPAPVAPAYWYANGR